ncbi:MAG: Sapep family Mn(2+)-dependent dipeptidase [Eggerthellales bacterium]|nr:Sapep family Mn(2+)-dependent dipeptidase [Eggerthellales bacterium]
MTNGMTPRETELLARADAFIQENWEDIVAEIGKLVAIPSVVDYDRATPLDPNGPEAHDGLRAGVDLAQRLGFDAADLEGQIGIADLKGTSDTQIGMICHTDVVAPGVGWTVSPWEMQRRDGYLLGRGVIDDKGPLVISLYCMKFFAEASRSAGTPLPYTLRMLIGTNEEVGMDDVAWYLDRYEAPAFLFTSDADFPICYGEKGSFHGEFTSAPLTGNIVDFTTRDSATNAVPSRAWLTVTVPGAAGADGAASSDSASAGAADAVGAADAAARFAASLPAADGIKITPVQDGTVQLVATGVGGHASLPEGTRSAIGMLIDYGLVNGLFSPSEQDFLVMAKRIIAAPDGSAINLATCDDAFGPLTIVAGTIHKVADRLTLSVDSRYPTSITCQELLERMQSLAADVQATFETSLLMDPFLVDPEGPIITTLLAAYHDATGFDGEAFTIGGGTYARKFPCASSFGPVDPHEETPDWVGPMHGADEGVSEECLKRAMRVYILAIARLLEMDLATLK